MWPLGTAKGKRKEKKKKKQYQDERVVIIIALHRQSLGRIFACVEFISPGSHRDCVQCRYLSWRCVYAAHGETRWDIDKSKSAVDIGYKIEGHQNLKKGKKERGKKINIYIYRGLTCKWDQDYPQPGVRKRSYVLGRIDKPDFAS